MAFVVCALVPSARGHDERGGSLRDELRHTRGTYNHVQDEIASYGTNKYIRAEMGHIDAEIDHVEEELAYRDVDPRHIRVEVAHIHEELHEVSEQLHARGERQSGWRRGFTFQIR